MKPSRLLFLVGGIALVIIIFYSLDTDTSSTEYIKQVEDKREELDRFMRTSSDSPFLDKDFDALQYFPVDEKYRVVATLVPVEKKSARFLTTTDGKQQHYMEYAYAEFELEHQPLRLLILEIADPGPFRGKLFLGFTDNTSAEETYGAGRYLDLTKSPGSRTIELDFNHAYNPYCAYSEKYSCPLPPRENMLPISIYAGEKNYKDH